MNYQKPFILSLFIFMAGISLSACSGVFGAYDEYELGTASSVDLRDGDGVNAFLWRAALDTVSDLPVAETDAAGGVILTDWIINPDAPGERLKMTIMILDNDLRADALRVSVQRQVTQGGSWVNAPVRAGTALQIEDTILARARQLRISTLDDE